MTSSELLEAWSISEEWLRKASSLIAMDFCSEDGQLSAFESFLSHNELELALEELAEAATHSHQERHFWDAMVQAAMSMKLDEQAQMFTAHLATSSGVKVTD